MAAKEWQIVLDKAKAYGWKDPVETTAHKKIIIKCPKESSVCTIQIFGSGKGSESAAQTYIDKIDRCPHRKMKSPLAKIDRALDAADRLITGGERMVAAGRAADKVNELLDEALAAVDEAGAELERMAYIVDEEREELTAEAAELLGTDPAATRIGDLAGAAQSELRTARLELRDLPKKAGDVLMRRERHERLTARLRKLSA